MANIDFMFPGFLSDPETYDKLEDYWRLLIRTIAPDATLKFIDNVYANGTKMRDGNPILNVIINNVSIWVLVYSETDYNPVEPVDPDYMFCKYIDNVEYDCVIYPELNINLFMTPDNVNKAIKEIVEWLRTNINTPSDIC